MFIVFYLGAPNPSGHMDPRQPYLMGPLCALFTPLLLLLLILCAVTLFRLKIVIGLALLSGGGGTAAIII